MQYVFDGRGTTSEKLSEVKHFSDLGCAQITKMKFSRRFFSEKIVKVVLTTHFHKKVRATICLVPTLQHDGAI